MNKSDKNYRKLYERIAKYNVILQEKFDLIDESDKRKIYISFGTNNIIKRLKKIILLIIHFKIIFLLKEI